MGTSWQGTSVRDGGMLIDLSRLTDVRVDPDSRTASVQPGGRGRELNNLLEPHGLMFPTGHCPGVGIGGFLLQGGWGWNSRLLGPACMGVDAVEVVTAEGELIRADATQHSDYLWAARGAGPGFFGIVTRFEIRAHPRPAAMLGSGYVYPLALLDEVLRWPVDQMRRLEPLSKGIQLADENLVSRPWPYLSGENERRLEALRARHDPDGLFHSYLTA